VLDFTTGRPISARQAVLRSVVVVLEVAAVPTVVLAVPALVEVASIAGSGRSVTDRLLGTVVLSRRRPSERALTSVASAPM